MPARFALHHFCAALSLLTGGLARAQDGNIFSVDYPPSDRPGECQIGVTHTVWIPENAKTLRGVIVHQHGCGTGACKGGATAAHDLHWQALARKWDCALLGPSYHQAEDQNCRLWCDPRNGSGALFERALGDLAQKSGHAELATVPWCLWGHSGGGFWASLLQMSRPERIVAIWFQSGTAFGYWEKGEIEKPVIPEAAMRIPMMSNPGVKEKDHERFRVAWDAGLAMFRAYRAKGAPIGFAPDPRTGHETGDSRYLSIPFFDACLAQRLPEHIGQPLKPVDASHAWLAPVLGDNPVPTADFQGKADEAVWLPDAAVAAAWSEFVKTGAAFSGDPTPPPAPGSVSVSAAPDGGIELRWTATADFETGLQGFLILKDDKEIARVPEKPAGKFGRPLFQSMSYHDTPEAPLPAMQYRDADGKLEEASRYAVAAINSIGLKSAPAAAVAGKN